MTSAASSTTTAATAVATTKNTTAAAATATTTSGAGAVAAPTTLLVSPENQHIVDELAVAANAYSSAHGIQVESQMMAPFGAASSADGGTTTTTTTLYKCAPVSLLPNAYPKPAFDDAVSLATSFNLLVDRVSRDAMFLLSTLGGGVATADPFTARLLQLYQSIYVNETTKVMAAITADRLGIHRSDYMLHQTTTSTDEETKPPRYAIKQVELNTIAASFAGLSSRVTEMHCYLTDRYDSSVLREYFTVNQNAVGGSINNGTPDVPVNPTLVKLPSAMSLVVERYKQRFFGIGQNDKDKKDDKNHNLVVLFVVQEGETNTVDQRLLEFHLFQNHGLRVVRASLATIAKHAILSTTDGRLTLFGKEIALIYFRAGYAPTDYRSTDDSEWTARATLEGSRAAKCPSLGYHLAGTKKIQQALARPGVLERYFASPVDDVDVVTKLRSAFAGLYSLDVTDMTAEDYRAVRHVLDDPSASERYVLKPQREGGGYNFYGPDLLAKIEANVTVNDCNEDDAKSLTLHESLGEYILMERLFPPQQTAILLRNGQVEGTGDSISELGCYGTIITDGMDGTVIANEYAGYLLRTKFSTVNEGGVASGFATLSSPYLC